MGDKWFPRTIKPLTDKNYSMSRGGNVIGFTAAGSQPRTGLSTTLEPVTFSLNFNMNDNAYRAFLNFYDAGINHGANSFKMNLDSGNGIEEHQCIIKPGTIKATRPMHGTWFVAMTVITEITSSQTETGTSLYEAYDL